MTIANKDGGVGAAELIASRALSQSWAASGIIIENFDPVTAITSAAPTTQKVFGDLFGFSAGQVITGVVLRNAVAAAGTLPTTVRVGISDRLGNVLAISGNLNALASWAAGPNKLPFAAPYQVPSDGGYYLCFVVNGTWGSTQPTPIKHTGGIGAALTALPGASAPSFEWAGQTDLPAVGAALTLTTASSVPYYIAAY